LPYDTERKVYEAYERWNLRVRKRLDAETGLSMAGKPTNLPIKIVEGLPLSFAGILREFDDPDFWWLTAHRELLNDTHSGLMELSHALNAPRSIIRAAGANETTQNELHHIANIILQLLEPRQTKQVEDRLRELDHDVLGAYFYQRPEIHLYWMVIGFYASLLRVKIEHLTVVVLAHELAHAYTHLGADIDGTRWHTDAFASADIRIVEGLAQLYTDVVIDQFDQAGIRRAFEALLERQSTPYTIFRHWTPDESRGEIIRTAMIQTRRTRNSDYDLFHRALELLKVAPAQVRV
jgi:hypothetical protein